MNRSKEGHEGSNGTRRLLPESQHAIMMQNHNHTHGHSSGHAVKSPKPPRPRSVSRSSSSPSPPPDTPRAHQAQLNGSGERQKRRTSASSHRPMVNGRNRLHINTSGNGRQTRGRAPRDVSQPESNGQTEWNESSNAHAGPSTIPESPLLSWDEGGFSTQYGASASSPASASGSERDRSWFKRDVGQESETDYAEVVTAREAKDSPPRGSIDSAYANGVSLREDVPSPPPSGGSQQASSRSRQPFRPPPHLSFSQRTVLPIRLAINCLHLAREGNRTSDKKGKGRAIVDAGYKLTRRRCEDGLVLGAVVLGIWKLAREWREKALAGEISLLVGLSVIYTAFRARPVPTPSRTRVPPDRPNSPSATALNHSAHHNHVRERSAKSTALHQFQHPSSSAGNRDDQRNKGVAAAAVDEGDTVVGGNGCVWGTEEREYRECLDDGVFFALLLGPLIAAAMLHSAMTQLKNFPDQASTTAWNIESPLVLSSTPLRLLSKLDQPPEATEAVKALLALATSRRNLVQLFTLCSFVLLVQLGWSLRLELRLAKAASVPMTPNTGVFSQVEKDPMDPIRSSSPSLGIGIFWLRKGEWRRNLNAVGMAFAVTAGCIVVKVVTAFIGHGVWSDMSASDIIIATLFYQFSLYVCVRLARRGFTLGELGVVCNAATALVMETVNLTRMKIKILRTPYIKTYRFPTPLLIFQLALIPGSLLAGFLLSPLLYLSRHLAQRPAHRLRFPHEKPMHRRLLAIGFYAGSALVCGGIVGTWTSWCLSWRNPFTWVIYWLLDGGRPWTRPALLAYWGILAAISVAGWNRQLARARRQRRYVAVNPSRDQDGKTTFQSQITYGAPPSSANANIAHNDPSGLSGVASQMMDAADQRMPTLSVNARRKFFHALAVIMFVPGIAFDPAFTHLSFSVAFAAFNFAEYIRYFALWPFGVSVHLFLNEFLDHKDSGTAILSHFYLLTGCASPLWLEGPTQILHYIGILSLGIGDALASIIGRKMGRLRWSRASGKTVEGSVAFFISVLLSSGFLWATGLVEAFNMTPYTIAVFLMTLLEAFSAQNDNLILPMYGWAVSILLGV